MKICLGLGNDLDETLGQEFGIVDLLSWVGAVLGDGRFVEIVTANIIEQRPGVAMSRRNHDMGNREARESAGLGAGIGRDVERKADQIAEDKGNLFSGLIN